MREIKFRAWHYGLETDTPTSRKKFGEWLYPHQMLYEDNPGDCLVWKSQGQNIEVMQYTGLKDKNGKEIYEGDILQIIHEDGDSDVYQVRYMGDMDYPAFDLVPHLECDSNGLSHVVAVCEVEVIGNIHEHPQLLE